MNEKKTRSTVGPLIIRPIVRLLFEIISGTFFPSLFKDLRIDKERGLALACRRWFRPEKIDILRARPSLIEISCLVIERAARNAGSFYIMATSTPSREGVIASATNRRVPV